MSGVMLVGICAEFVGTMWYDTYIFHDDVYESFMTYKEQSD